ncbi:5-(carboxyamino)imidazole ribonucleotide mutase [Calditerrivibrio nitroreducens]|uniref:N5-carboxyaminoimidazole ribonucleotide mutase n=1 Tax=Calditerrivibrio nitroreducens (strain DSM 19672 / NBRC 101217 / Yu37-1) TaxID=768670 RepID=E4TGA9_CALNY|nr:5-(carboxyamino)imidazole ribonucleotide mutase [Calditerrivibrio nitroreducens]ADR19696.1 5-(carboxyamino)imidazole ribonucleotide mutase [Calditerrivibrio nitroreducens DSM 19672]
MSKPIVGILMGSDSDLPVIKKAADIFKEFNVPYEIKVLSAHRTPDETIKYTEEAKDRGIEILIAGAGGAAHLPGVIAAKTTLPVIGIPMPSKFMDGLDSLLSIVQMPKGIPVATVGVGIAENAALLAIRILALKYEEYQRKLEDFIEKQRQKVLNIKIEE